MSTSRLDAQPNVTEAWPATTLVGTGVSGGTTSGRYTGGSARPRGLRLCAPSTYAARYKYRFVDRPSSASMYARKAGSITKESGVSGPARFTFTGTVGSLGSTESNGLIVIWLNANWLPSS